MICLDIYGEYKTLNENHNSDVCNDFRTNQIKQIKKDIQKKQELEDTYRKRRENMERQLREWDDDLELEKGTHEYYKDR